MPFENLDILYGKNISLSTQQIFEKIVLKKRGGVCYETNILFHDLLASLGFKTAYLSARSAKAVTGGPAFDHMVLRVAVDGNDYLVDVGKGQSCRKPLSLDDGYSLSPEGVEYRVASRGSDYVLYSRKDRRGWSPRLYFDSMERRPADFEEMNVYLQTSPDSPFTKRAIVTVATLSGRRTLIDRQLTITVGTRKRMHAMETGDYLRVIRRCFGIDLNLSQNQILLQKAEILP